MKSNPYIFNLFTYNTHDLANRAIMRGGVICSYSNSYPLNLLLFINAARNEGWFCRVYTRLVNRCVIEKLR